MEGVYVIIKHTIDPDTMCENSVVCGVFKDRETAEIAFAMAYAMYDDFPHGVQVVFEMHEAKMNILDISMTDFVD